MADKPKPKPNLFLGTDPVPGLGLASAQSRFTKTPITFDMRLRSRTGPVPGRYYPNPSDIVIYPTKDASYQDINSVIHHEDTHALLDKSGAQGSRGSLDRDLMRIPGAISPLGMEQFLPENFGMSGQPGFFSSEWPAYMTAYKEGEMPDITPEMAASWLFRYADRLPTDAKRMLMRIAASHQAVQGIQPVQSQPQPEQSWWQRMISGR